MDVGILGATGPAGQAMAARLASIGIGVAVGSRSRDRAAATCDALRAAWPDRNLPLAPATNEEAAAADLVIVATPWNAAATTAASVARHLSGKVVVSMANALGRVDGELQALDLPERSVAAGVQAAVPDALVAAAFHHLPARSLARIDRPVEGDVLICSNHEAAVSATAELAAKIPDLRPLHAGSLSAAAPVEAFTAVLLGLNARYRVRAALRLTGLDGTLPVRRSGP
jgi:NADPH-dependent F420 reductase